MGKNVAVIGAGVIGLTTALKLQERGYAVEILAKIFPTDSKSIEYTSHWAGAHHVSLAAKDARQLQFDKETFRVLWQMSETDCKQCFLRLTETEYFHDDRPKPSHLDFMPSFRYLGDAELIPGARSGVQFQTLTIDVPRYVNYLLSLFISRGGNIQRASIQHIDQVAEGAFGLRPDAIVVCAGLGARILGGVEDKDVFPIRGQTVLLRAPWIRFGRAQSGGDGSWTYIIPRRSGDVVVGGTKVPNDWYPKPREDTTADILERALALCPELSPKFVQSHDREVSSAGVRVEDLSPIIIESGCGFRPGRKGGIRLETRTLETHNGMRVPVVHNYGHGESGFQSSWGSATVALELLNKALTKQ